MTTWRNPHRSPPVVLRVSGSLVELDTGGAVERRPAAAFMEGDLAEDILERFDLSTLAEAHAVARDPSISSGAAPDGQRISGRPVHPRMLGGGRGAPWTGWIFGRRLVLSLAGGERHERSFDEVLATGLPDEVADVMSARGAAEILLAIQELAPLPCMCGTGCETADQHGDTRRLIRIEHPHAPVEHTASVEACTICGRLWTFETCGDSHHGYTCRARLFAPRAD